MKKDEGLYFEFFEWVVGLLEEDPLDYEITTVYFLYGKINNLPYIRMLATEIDNGLLSDFTYNPLEAQFFYSKSLLNTFTNKQGLDKLKDFIVRSLNKLKEEQLLEDLIKKNIKVVMCNYYI